MTLGTTAHAAELLPQYERSFGPDGSELTGFYQAGPVAIDQSTHAVYVIDHKGGSGEGSLLKFDGNGSPLPFGGSAPYISGNRITGLTFAPGPSESQVAVDANSHDIYVTSNNAITAFHANGEPAEFTAGPGAGSNEIGGFNEQLGLAVDGNGTIYASDYPSTVKLFTHAGEPITQFSGGNGVTNLAVDTHGDLYINRYLSNVTEFEPSSYPVTSTTTYSSVGAVDPNPSFTVAVDPATNDVYIAEAAEFAPEPRIAHYSETGVLLATFAAPGEEGEISRSEGLAVDGTSGNIFVSNAPESGLSQVELFGPYEGNPVVVSRSVTDVTAHTATLRARINPGRAETTYRFEYGLSDCSLGGCISVPAGGASVGDGHKSVDVSQPLTGLSAGTTYHWRIIATNEFGDNVAAEGDHTFTTQTGALDFRLSDGRAWELVSPSDKHGARVRPSSDLVQAAVGGEGVIYQTVGSVEQNPAGSRAFEPSTVLSRRSSTGWQSTDLTPPNDEVSAVLTLAPYKLFSRDLSRGLLEPRTATQLSPEAYGQTPYLRLNTEPPAYKPLVTAADIRPGTEDGEFSIVGASRDRDEVAITSTVPLVDGAPPSPQVSLYLWAGGLLKPISVLPESEGGGMVGTELIGSGSGSTRQAISEDGSRVFWSTGVKGATAANSITGLYVRDTVAEASARLDEEQPGATGFGLARPTFQGASADGGFVFFTDTQQLTPGAGTSGSDLYRCEIAPGPAASGCASLVDLTSQTENPGESAEVLGISPGLAEDGTAIYFVALGLLDSTSNEAGDSAVSGEPNLYVWRQGEGPRFIATLSPNDKGDWGLAEKNDQENEFQLTAYSSPSGRYFSFLSQDSLTGSDNISATSGEPVQQVYRYDAGTDRLDCASCLPTGAAPNGEFENGSWAAAALPNRSTKDTSGLTFYAPRAVLDNGRVFFNSIDPLVPADSNGQWDVYQYETPGVGDCTDAPGNAATVRAGRGCLSLISSGTAAEEASFLDASESGDDVFFFTSAALNATDEDSELDVYDARVGGVPGIRQSPVECLGEACQPSVGSPSDPTPSSESYAGPGNLNPGRRCPRGKHLVRRKGKKACVRKAHRHKRHHHQRLQKRAGPSGRTSK